MLILDGRHYTIAGVLPRNHRTVIGFGLSPVPALRAVRSDVNAVLKRHERQADGGWNVRSVLVAGQVAVSVVLLATGFLFLRNLF